MRHMFVCLLLCMRVYVYTQLRQAKVEEFLEELQARSRSRCATLGLIRAFGSGPTHTDTTQGGQQQQTSQDEETFNKLVAFYAVKQRAGKRQGYTHRCVQTQMAFFRQTVSEVSCCGLPARYLCDLCLRRKGRETA